MDVVFLKQSIEHCNEQSCPTTIEKKTLFLTHTIIAILSTINIVPNTTVTIKTTIL